MIKMAKCRCDDILDSFKSDSTGLPNTCEVRAKELADSSLSMYRWWEDAYSLTTTQGRYRNRYYEIYENTFSRQKIEQMNLQESL